MATTGTLKHLAKHLRDEDAARQLLERLRWPRWRCLPPLRDRQALQARPEGRLDEAGPPWRLQVPGLPQAVHRDGRDDHGAEPHPALDLAPRLPPHVVEQEGL